MTTPARSSSPVGAAVLIAVTVLAAAAPRVFNLKTYQSPVQQQADQQLSQVATLSEFEEIRSGLTMAQVNLLLGRPGQEVTHLETPGTPITSLYTWQNPDGSRINVTFQNGTVVAKTQSGLQ